MRKFLLPPFLPLLVVLLLLLGLAVYQSQMDQKNLPMTTDGEVMRWILFVPFVIPFIYLFYFVLNLSDFGIQCILPLKFYRFSFIVPGLIAGLYLNMLSQNELGPAWRACNIGLALVAAGLMSFWRMSMCRRDQLRIAEQASSSNGG